MPAQFSTSMTYLLTISWRKSELATFPGAAPSRSSVSVTSSTDGSTVPTSWACNHQDTSQATTATSHAPVIKYRRCFLVLCERLLSELALLCSLGVAGQLFSLCCEEITPPGVGVPHSCGGAARQRELEPTVCRIALYGAPFSAADLPTEPAEVPSNRK